MLDPRLSRVQFTTLYFSLLHYYTNKPNGNYIPEICFWLRRRRLRRRRTPTLVQAITLSQIGHTPIKFIFAIAIEVPDYKNPMIFGINRKNKMASGGHFVYKFSVSNFVINSPINFIFGTAIDNTYWKNPIVFGANQTSNFEKNSKTKKVLY